MRIYAAGVLDLQGARRLAALSASLRRAAHERGWDADFVSPAALHVTLAVLDDIDLGLIDPVAAALVETARSHRPMRLQLAGVRAGEDPAAPRFLCAGVSQGAELLDALGDELWRRLDGLGLSAPSTPAPRLLLARVRRAATPLSELLRPGDDLGVCVVSELALYRAERARDDVEPPSLTRVALSSPRAAVT